MKKSLLFFVLLGIVVFGLSAQERFPDLKRYFILIQQLDSPNWDFSRNPFYGETPAVHTLFSNLTGKLDVLDSYLEMALITYYSAAERPWAERGNSVLPLNNPRLVDRQLGAHVYKDLVVFRFLNDTAAVSRHEAVLSYITGRGNATRTEIESFYRSGIRALISEVVDEEFNKVSFVMGSPTGGYNAVLTRNPQSGHYILRYTDARDNTKESSANSLEALSSAMSGNVSEFNQNGINTVRAQAALIPAVVLSDAALDEVKNIVVNFYTNPNAATYTAVVDVMVLYDITRLRSGNDLYMIVNRSYFNVFSSLNDGLARKVSADGNKSSRSVLSADQQQRLVGVR